MQGGGSELARGEYFELVGAALRELDCAVSRGVVLSWTGVNTCVLVYTALWEINLFRECVDSLAATQG